MMLKFKVDNRKIFGGYLVSVLILGLASCCVFQTGEKRIYPKGIITTEYPGCFTEKVGNKLFDVMRLGQDTSTLYVLKYWSLWLSPNLCDGIYEVSSVNPRMDVYMSIPSTKVLLSARKNLLFIISSEDTTLHFNTDSSINAFINEIDFSVTEYDKRIIYALKDVKIVRGTWENTRDSIIGTIEP